MKDPVAAGSAENLQVSRPRYEFLDGIRALAALYVVFGHSFAGINKTAAGTPVPDFVVQAIQFRNSFGRLGVCSFVVLSGFCLMLPVASKGTGKVTGGLLNYTRRRARRILPPYYASIVLALMVMTLIWLCNPGNDVAKQQLLKSLEPGALLSHLFLVHTWSTDWAIKINGPLWTIGTEWQIYFLFPLVLLPAWRYAGSIGCLAMAFVVGTLIPKRIEAYGAWFPMLFAGGMCVAAITRQTFNSSRLHRVFERLPWMVITLAFLGVLIYATNYQREWFFTAGWFRFDFLAMVIGSCLLFHCVYTLQCTPACDNQLRVLLVFRGGNDVEDTPGASGRF